MMVTCFLRLICGGLITCLLSSPALADSQETQFYNSVPQAKSAQSTYYDNLSLDLSSFCQDDNPNCEAQIQHPAEAGMSDADITNASTSAFYSNDQALAIQDNFNNHSHTLDPNDDTYRFATLGIDNAYEISHGISNPYVDCDSGQQCLISQEEKRCTEPTHTPVPCFDEPVFTDMNLNQGHTRFSAGDHPDYPGFSLGWSEVTLPSQAQYITGVNIPDFHVIMVWQQDIHFKINGQTVAIQNYIITSCNMLCAGYTPGGFFAVDPPIKVNGPVKLSTYTSANNGYDAIIGEGWYGWGSTSWNPPSDLVLHWNEPSYTLNWHSTCSAMGPQCQPSARRCIEGRATKNISGIDITLDCWKYQTDYQCQFEGTCASLSDCEYQSSTCSLMQNGVCVEEEIVKSCEVQDCDDTNLVCGDTSFCLDGDCFEPNGSTNDHFDESAAALAALAEAADGIGNPPKIFTGQGMQCTDKPIGIANCCQDGGWGTDLGIASCSDEEKALGQAKEQGITVYLGDYCAEDIFGWCIRKKKSYCVYDSKLARIIQEQGSRGQLGISLGSAEHPICGALTPEQLQNIDFELLDFSDFYNDMHANAQLPDANEIQSRLQSAYDQ